jgi:signal transduction histidine kinase
VSVGIGLCVLLDLLDRLPAGGLLPAEGIPLGPYGAVVTFAVFAHLMHRRFSSALREVGDTHRQLALRLQQREAELTETHRRLRAAEQQQTRSQERRRLMQDMHDGLGASLQGALASVAAGPLDEAAIRQLLRGCIDDLRLTIDSMEPVDADLLLLLATLRYRLGGRLQAAGIRLRWEVTDLPRLEGLDPRCALHILRILQETLGNCVQHAQATEIRVQTGFDAHWVQVQITDDGPGFDLPSALRSGGQGLATQLRRAEAIGARVDWQPDPATGRGCCMTLRLPRQAPPGPPPG